MRGTRNFWIGMVALFMLTVGVQAALREDNDAPPARTSSEPAEESDVVDSVEEDSTKPNEAIKLNDDMSDVPVTPSKLAPKKAKKAGDDAAAFVAGPDWEFDGFVAGGQDQSKKSMFATEDILYLNVGPDDGLQPGNRISIYKRGQRVRDPQTGKFIGYEVRRAAVAEVTNRVDRNTSAVRIKKIWEPVEIGDLVRRAN